MKLLTAIATSTLLTVSAATSTVAFSAAPTQSTQAAKSILTLDHAINIAQRNGQGIVKSVEFDADDSEYEVELVSNKTSHEIKINANSGKVIKSENKQLSQNDIRKYAPLTRAKTSLTQAINTASKNLQGQVTEAEFDTEDGKPVYEVKVMKAGEKYKTYIDVTSGQIIKTERD